MGAEKTALLLRGPGAGIDHWEQSYALAPLQRKGETLNQYLMSAPRCRLARPKTWLYAP